MRQYACIANAVLCAAVIAVAPCGAVDVITTFAGNGANSNFADGIPATASAIGGAADQNGVAFDAAGNIFFADLFRIRRIDAATGIVTTVAGTGVAGFSGDGGPATAATFTDVPGLFVDSSGNLFIADEGNDRIRKVAAGTGIITTVAGSGGGVGCNPGLFAGDGLPATTASLNHPQGVFVDNSGNILIADTDNHCVRKVTAATGLISTIAGQGGVSGNGGDGNPPTLATFDAPAAVTMDSGGAIYIADSNNNRVRVISGGMIFNYAGDSMGMSGYMGDTGLATAALLTSPTGLAVDSSDNLYIADRDNDVVRQVLFSTSHINTVVGTGVNGFSGDGAAATAATLTELPAVAVLLGATPDIAVFDRNNFRIRKVHAGIINTIGGSGSGAFADGPAAAASFFRPSGMFADATGNVYVADTRNNRIRRIDAASGAVSTIAGTGVSGFSGDGGPAVSAQLHHPGAVIADGAGNVIFADSDNACVRRISAGGTITTIAGQGGMSGFSGDNGPAVNALLDAPDAIGADAAGNLYILDSQDRILRRVNASGIITTIAGAPGVKAFAGDGGPASGARFCSPQGLFVEAASGNIYIADADNARIRRIDPSGNISTVAGNGLLGNSGDGGPATAASLLVPNGVSALPNGDIFIADVGAHVIRKVTGATGIISTIAGTGVPGFSGDGGVALSARLAFPSVVIPAPGGLFILDHGNNRVRRTTFNGPPAITNVAVSQTQALVNTPITVTVTATDPENDALTYTFDPGDGTGAVNTGAVNTFTHTFTTAGAFTTALTVSDPFQTTTKPGNFVVFAPASGGAGVVNIAQGDPAIGKVTDPINGISISVTNSDGGVIELFIDVASLTREDFNVSTDFTGIAGRSLVVQKVGTVSGVRPVQQFAEQGVYVATSSATRTADNSAAGKARKTLVIDRTEVGDTALKLTAPKSRKVTAKSIKGNFIFGRSGAAAAGSKGNNVTLSGTIVLPDGLDSMAPLTVQVGIGNIVDSVTIDSRGNGKLPSLNKYIQKFQMRVPKPKSGAIVPSDKPVTFSMTFNDKALIAADPTLNMVDSGFDTEGVSATIIPSEKALKSLTRQIQLALAVNGVAYQSSVPVTFKRSARNDSGTIAGRSGK